MKPCGKCKKYLPLDSFYKCKSKRDGLQSKCKDCSRDARIKWEAENPEKTRSYSREWHRKNPKKSSEKSRRWHQKNPSWQRDYAKKRRACDPIFAMKSRVRSRLRYALSKISAKKREKTSEILGCTWEFFSEYIESKFKDGMCWDNRGDWHIDHITPLALAKNCDELIKLCHYTNLQPLWAYDNKSKGAKTIQDKS